MADQSREFLEKLRQIGQELRKLAERTLEVAADLSPSDGEQVRQSAVKLVTFSEKLDELATRTGPSMVGLRSTLEESMRNYLTAALETLNRIAHQTEEGAGEPVN